MRANDYEKHQILLKIERDNERCESLRQQKMEMINQRRNQRDQAGRMKEAMQKKFEIMQRKGDIDVSYFYNLMADCVQPRELTKFGISQERFNNIVQQKTPSKSS